MQSNERNTVFVFLYFCVWFRWQPEKCERDLAFTHHFGYHTIKLKYWMSLPLDLCLASSVTREILERTCIQLPFWISHNQVEVLDLSSCKSVPGFIGSKRNVREDLYLAAISDVKLSGQLNYDEFQLRTNMLNMLVPKIV